MGGSARLVVRGLIDSARSARQDHPEDSLIRYLIDETYTALLVRVGREEAIRWGHRFRAGEAIEVVRIDESVEQDAWTILESHAEEHWSHVDATSFALMEREGITEAFAFDHHFTQRGLTLVPAT